MTNMIFGFVVIRNLSIFEVTLLPYRNIMYYRSGTVNSNTVNSKFHLIRSCCKYLARFLSFHV